MKEIKALFDPYQCICGGTFVINPGIDLGGTVKTNSFCICISCNAIFGLDKDEITTEDIQKFNEEMRNG